MNAPVGKSGPLTIFKISASAVPGALIRVTVASTISVRLCGGMLVAMPRAEVALSIHQRIAHGKWLRQSHQRVVHRQIAVRMVDTQSLAVDFRALHVLLVMRQSH